MGPLVILAAITQLEAIVWPALGLLYLVALLGFIRVLLRGDVRPWRVWRVGVYTEREPRE
jgi:hypothetical protein